MATITNATLSITSDTAKQTSRCVITCRVLFTQFEMNQMRDGLKFALNATLFGDDTFNDDRLFNYATKFFPDATPSSSETSTFDVTVGTSLLNEDILGKDEVYGFLTLHNLYTRVKVSARTNVIKRSF